VNKGSNIYDVIIAGGGLAGLICAIELSKAGKHVLLIEKKEYPFHKVCGEYVSNEVLPYLQYLGFNPFHYGASRISQLRLSTPKGKSHYAQLQLGGFGISRYTMDSALFALAKEKGCQTLLNTRVTGIDFREGIFYVEAGNITYTSKFVIGSYGKRDTLDKKLERSFIDKHTGYLGIKYHVKTDYPVNEVGLDNFDNGYCGIAKIEGDHYNLCYLYKRKHNDDFKSMTELEEAVLYKNPTLKHIFSNAEFVYDKPEAINEICFDKKEPVWHHIFMCGDSAGLITPLCGNGMSMAIAGAKMLCNHLIKSGLVDMDVITVDQRNVVEQQYSIAWHKAFGRRLFWGRTIQSLFGSPAYTSLFINAAFHSPFKDWLIRQTHGQPLKTTN
jgi:menaquinone-9 beta-reductase